MVRPGLVWFKYGDLRSLDHLPLRNANKLCSSVDCVYIFDPDDYRPNFFGQPKSSIKRLGYLYESLQITFATIASSGGFCHAFVGKSSDVLLELSSAWSIDTIFAHDERIYEEYHTLQLFKEKCTCNWNLHLDHGGLISLDTLPFPLSELDTFTSFKNAVYANNILSSVQTHPAVEEWKSGVNLPSPDHLQKVDISDMTNTKQNILSLWNKLCDINEQPTWQYFDENCLVDDERSALYGLIQGEGGAHLRLHQYLQVGVDTVSEYASRRNEMLGGGYSTKFGSYLAIGAMTSRQICNQLNIFQMQHSEYEESVNLLIFELLWRDFMRLYAWQVENKLFLLHGCQPVDTSRRWSRDQHRFLAWCEGRTGYPFIDACMKELVASGYCSNRGRQVVASFLINDLGLDWRLGASFFEAHLLDYDVCSNYGNWQYAAGVGRDPRSLRYFQPIKQAYLYDPEALFIRTWCPELSHLSTEALQDPAGYNNATVQIVPLLHPATLEEVKKQVTKSKRLKGKRLKHGSIPALQSIAIAPDEKLIP